MWLIIALISLAVLIILILSIPLEFSFQYNSQEKQASRFRLVWLFGLLSINLAGKERKTSQKEKQAPTVETKGAPGHRPDMRFIMRILQIKGLLDQLKRLLIDTLSCLHSKELCAHFKISLDDPADTGALFALSEPFNYIMQNRTPVSISIKPCFYEEAYFEANINTTLRLLPVTLLKLLTSFIFAMPVFRAIKLLVIEWKRKR